MFTDSPSFTCNDRYEVEEHGKLQTDCEPKGIPKPVVTWFKDGKMMASPHWTKNDSGEYLLEATNKHGTASHTLYIDVLCKLYCLRLVFVCFLLTVWDYTYIYK